MRILLLLRGSASCGKSTWIAQNGLKPYTLSADDIRLLCQRRLCGYQPEQRRHSVEDIVQYPGNQDAAG